MKNTTTSIRPFSTASSGFAGNTTETGRGGITPQKGRSKMTIWVVTINGEPEFASTKYFEAASRYNFLVNAGYSNVELKRENAD